MAFVTIRGGHVVSQNAKGFTLVETYTRKDGDESKTYYKVWTEEPVDQNVALDVSGILSVRVNEYEGTTRAEIHINKPRITVSEAKPSIPVPQTFGRPLVIEADAPF